MTALTRLSPEFRAYERARDAVLQMKQQSGGSGTSEPSAYWTEELENIDYMIDATPLIVAKLRQHAFHITGIRPYDYREKNVQGAKVREGAKEGKRELFEARLRALVAAGGESLLVPESPALGGFGYDIDGRLFNVDTLKFAEVLVGMERGGVLTAIRQQNRPVVCEIGAGWGGFAFQLKTLFPSSTYVIVDFPELFLFSATYLGALFPDARIVFCGTAAGPPLDGWSGADFVFVPHTLANAIASLPLELTVNMVSFQEMTDAQVRAYADIVANAGCRLLYSLNRDRSPYNTQLISVSEALADRYRLTEVPVLDGDYTSAMKKPPKPGKMAGRSEFNYRHLVGRLDRAGVATDRAAASHSVLPRRTDGPRVVLGMTLYNNARHLREAMDSLLAQTFTDFALLLLDDASSDATEAIAREYEARDPRIRYAKHASRQAMIATWREVAELAARTYPSAEFFAWVSDHDRWHERWLELMVGELIADPAAVLAYPITRRVSQEGGELDKGPRLFDTRGCADLPARWRHFCHEGIGSGDMVYGLMRIDALMKAGIFRRVMRPDRLLVTELTLYGRFRQVPEVLWFRRESNGTSIDRQRYSLVLQGDEPRWFLTPPWFQHSIALWETYVTPESRPLPLSRGVWLRMLFRYQVTYGWRHFRKTRASHAIGRGIDNVIWLKKMTKHYYHHAVYNALVGARVAWGRTRRLSRRGVYEVLMLTHRLGLRGRGDAHSR